MQELKTTLYILKESGVINIKTYDLLIKIIEKIEKEGIK
jgi:hypothetical protein